MIAWIKSLFRKRKKCLFCNKTYGNEIYCFYEGQVNLEEAEGDVDIDICPCCSPECRETTIYKYMMDTVVRSGLTSNLNVYQFTISYDNLFNRSFE